MSTDDIVSGSAPIRQRRADEKDDRKDDTTHDARALEPLAPDAVSPGERSDADGPLRGNATADTGLGAAGGRDRSSPGGREPEPGPRRGGLGVHGSSTDHPRDEGREEAAMQRGTGSATPRRAGNEGGERGKGGEGARRDERGEGGPRSEGGDGRE